MWKVRVWLYRHSHDFNNPMYSQTASRPGIIFSSITHFHRFSLILCSLPLFTLALSLLFLLTPAGRLHVLPVLLYIGVKNVTIEARIFHDSTPFI